MSTKALWDLVDEKLVPYPRYDDEPVAGLDTERYAALSLVREPEPEYDPLIERVVATSALDLEALTYTYGWTIEPLPPPEPLAPDYRSFYGALLVSGVYQVVLTQVLSATSPAPAGALAVFVSAMQDCLSGRANPAAMQQAIWLLLSQLTLSEENVGELQQMLNDAHLDSIYSLVPVP